MLVRALAASALFIGACERNEVPVAHDNAIKDTGAAARAARRAGDDLRASRSETTREAARAGSAATSYVSHRDHVVGEARTHLAAMDQKIAELETYAQAGHVKDVKQADNALETLRAARVAASQALGDLSIASADNWEARRDTVTTSFGALDKAYKDARATMDTDTSTSDLPRVSTPTTPSTMRP